MPDDKPDLSALWPLLPPWIKWVAMSEGHIWEAYKQKPKKRHADWRDSDDWLFSFVIPVEYAPRWRGDWRKSLCKRSEGVK